MNTIDTRPHTVDPRPRLARQGRATRALRGLALGLLLVALGLAGCGFDDNAPFPLVVTKATLRPATTEMPAELVLRVRNDGPERVDGWGVKVEFFNDLDQPVLQWGFGDDFAIYVVNDDVPIGDELEVVIVLEGFDGVGNAEFAFTRARYESDRDVLCEYDDSTCRGQVFTDGR